MSTHQSPNPQTITNAIEHATAALRAELEERKWEGSRAMEAVNRQIEIIQGQRAELIALRSDRERLIAAADKAAAALERVQMYDDDANLPESLKAQVAEAIAAIAAVKEGQP